LNNNNPFQKSSSTISATASADALTKSHAGTAHMDADR
jgi:hypothetical protein